MAVKSYIVFFWGMTLYDISEVHNAASHSTWQIKAVCSSSTLVVAYHSTWRLNPENHNTNRNELEIISSMLRKLLFDMAE